MGGFIFILKESGVVTQSNVLKILCSVGFNGEQKWKLGVSTNLT